ncbi:hypothetical protein [Catenulispora subtropica]|uniref:Uncharacterized protein n=1 Tax=Catenulispora subtropica TaxID=450798 RepID=A0ABP5EBR5_9ACTN
MSEPIQADPDDLEKHGKVFADHTFVMASVHDDIYGLLAGDIGIGHDAFSEAFRINYLTHVRALGDSVKGAKEGVLGISEGMRKMAADYRATDDAALRGVTGTGSGLGPGTGGPHLPPSTPPHTGDPHPAPHKP